METRQPNAVSITGEQTEKDTVSNATFNKTEDVTNPKIPPVYKEDVVRCNKSGLLGIVTGIAGDSDSESEDTDDDEDDSDDDGEEVLENEKDNDRNSVNDDGNSDVVRAGDNDDTISLSPNQVKVIWMDDSERIQSVNNITVVDRGFMHGDYIASASEPTGQVGLVVDINISVDLSASDGSTVKDVSTRDLKRVRDLASGDYVVLGPWLGRVDDVSDNVTVLFADGSVCKVMRADPMHLIPVKSSVLDDGNFPYYPGQDVKASSSTVFKNARWLSGLWKANRLEGTVTKVTAGSVFVHWITSAGYGLDSSIAPAEEQSPKNLKHLSCFGHANWKLGDWCLLPSRGDSSSAPLSKDLSKSEIRDSDLNEDESDNAKLHSSGDSEMIALKESNVRNDSVVADGAATFDGTNINIELNIPPESSLCSTLLQVSKENVSEIRPLHRKKIRKVVVRRDKKARKKEENFERALVISNIRTTVDVAWQDGTIEHGLLSTTLIPIDNPGDHEFVAEQYVMEKSSDDSEDTSEIRRVGVVRSVNAKERTACIRWLKPVSRAEDLREFEEEEVVSVYELEGHIDYDYCYGDVVVRLSPVTVCTQPSNHGEYVYGDGSTDTKHSGHERAEDGSTDTNFTDFSDLSWVGNITGLRNGDIEVTWADGMVSTVGPQAIYVIVRDDDESINGGSEASDDAASWETMDDDEAETIENFIKETGLENNHDTNHELGHGSEEGENNLRKNGNMLAAFEFVAKIATGIFSLGRKHLDPHTSGSEVENELQSQEAAIFLEKGASSDDSGKSSANDDSNIQNAHVQTEVTADANDIAEAMDDLRLEVRDDLADFSDACGFKRFDISRDPVDHHFIGESGQKSNERKWLRKVQQDWSILQNNLPDGIYVRVYEDRMDLVRAVIVGAYGTPYQDGLFFFDFHLPPEYPSDPPSAYYHSGGWRINPNLYEEGKVCLSLLNTWHGKGNEMWDHASSSILQVLVSLQGLVLNSRPYFNEAGYDRQVGTAEGEKNSLSYNENTFLLNCKTMMFLIRRPPKDFEDLVKDHFKRHGYYILKACDAYMKGYLIGSLAKDASISENSDSHQTSVGFKLMLAKILPKLITTLNDIGVDCSEFKHLNQT